jgi:hypothetical protein
VLSVRLSGHDAQLAPGASSPLSTLMWSIEVCGTVVGRRCGHSAARSLYLLSSAEQLAGSIKSISEPLAEPPAAIVDGQRPAQSSLGLEDLEREIKDSDASAGSVAAAPGRGHDP